MPSLRGPDPSDQQSRFAVPTTAFSEYESPTYEDAAFNFETAAAAASTPANQLLLTEDPFSTEASRQLFDAIDQLRKCGAGQDIDLPELVIVGKQSSGKSSLLESLTEIPFPSDDNACTTRFATRIISRRSPPGTADLIKVSIEAGAVEQGDAKLFGYADVDGRTGSFNPSVESFTSEGFLQIMEQAKEVMSISRDRNFSSKVLKIELSGPDRSHFAILDLPGIFESEFGGRTSREANGIRQLVTRYMKQPRNIIICVAEATDDLANQRIFQLANENIDDPLRMVGVFTKCDRLEKPDKTISIVNNHEGIGGVALNGWFVVRNRGSTEKDFSSADRQKEENALFSKHPWVDIPEDRRGTPMLKRFLANLLCRRIREAFPGMQKAVQTLLTNEHEHLQILGKERSTQAQQQEFLRAIAQRFRTLADQALKSPAELPFDDLKLRGIVQEMNASFALNLKKHGHLYEFSDIENGTRRAEQQQKTSADMKQDSDSESESGSDNGPPHFKIQSMFHSRVSIPLTPEQSPRRFKKKSPAAAVHQQPTLYGEIKAQIKVNRGEELPGILNPSILKPLMRKQTSKWEGLAVAHSQHIAETTTAVAVRILHTVCAEQGVPNYTRNGLEDLIRQTFGAPSERRLVKQISELCYRMATGLLQTNNESFLEKVRNSRRLRFGAALERYNHNVPGVNFFNTDITAPSPGLHNLVQQLVVISPATIQLLFDELHSSQQKNTEDEIHDLLKAYYEVAQEDFIHDITTHIVEPFLNDTSGPLMGFSPDFIMKELREDRIEELGGEDESAVMNRKDAAARIKRLDEALEISSKALRKKGYFTRLLINNGYPLSLDLEHRRPKYFLEVKTTTSTCETRFFMSRSQYQRMQRMTSTRLDNLNPEIYILFRVFNLGRSDMDMKVYLDPEALRLTNELEFTVESYSVRPGMGLVLP